MRNERFRRGCAALLSVSLVSLGMQTPAVAGIVSTTEAMTVARHQADLTVVRDMMARADVREQMVALGVDPAEVDGRLAALTPAELSKLASDIQQAPAGGSSALAVIGIVFLVLLILEVTGTIDIFKKV